MPDSARRVAVFTRTFLPYSQTFIYDEVRAHERYEVETFAAARENEDRFPFAPVHTPRTALGRHLYLSTRRRRVFDRQLAGRFDLIHAHLGYVGAYALPFARRHGLPLVVTFHGNDVAMLAGERGGNASWRRRAPAVLAGADRMLAVSREIEAELVRLSGRPEAVRWQPMGVDTRRFVPVEHANDVPELVLVGRFVEKKGHRYAIAALRRVLDAGQAAHLTLVGEGPLLDDCRQQVAELGLQDAVTFAGVLPAADVAARVARADLALAPSVVAANNDREGSPTVAKEASSCAVPVVATDHADLPHIVAHGETGLVVPERDAAALAAAIEALLSDGPRRRAMGAAARARMIEAYDVRSVVRALEDDYDRLVAGAGGQG